MLKGQHGQLPPGQIKSSWFYWQFYSVNKKLQKLWRTALALILTQGRARQWDLGLQPVSSNLSPQSNAINLRPQTLATLSWFSIALFNGLKVMHFIIFYIYCSSCLPLEISNRRAESHVRFCLPVFSTHLQQCLKLWKSLVIFLVWIPN